MYSDQINTKTSTECKHCKDLEYAEYLMKTYKRFGILNTILRDSTNCTKAIVEKLQKVYETSEVPFSDSESVKIIDTVIMAYSRDVIPPFSAMGSSSAQSIFEPINQAILKSMHSAGKKFSKAEIHEMLTAKETSQFDTIYVKHVCSDVRVAYRYLCLFIRRNPHLYIVKRGSKGQVYYVTFNAFNMAIDTVTPKRLFPNVEMDMHRSFEENGETFLEYRMSLQNAEIFEAKLLKCKNDVNDYDSIEWDPKKEQFVLQTDFKEFFKGVSAEYVDIASIRTLNIAKVSTLVGPITATFMMKSLLYDIYKFDQSTIDSVVGFVCSKGTSTRDMKITNNGIFASLFSGTIPVAATSSASSKNNDNSSMFLFDNIALCSDSKSVGATKVASDRKNKEIIEELCR